MNEQEFERKADVVMERQDFVDNSIMEMLQELAGKPIEYDTELVGKIRDCIESEFVSRRIMTEDEFYPGFEE